MYANITNVTREKSYFGSQREGREFEAKFGFQMFQGNRAEQCLATVRSKCLQHKTVNPQSWTDAVLISVGTEIHIQKAPGHNPSSNFRSASQSLGISADPFQWHPRNAQGQVPVQDRAIPAPHNSVWWPSSRDGSSRG